MSFSSLETFTGLLGLLSMIQFVAGGYIAIEPYAKIVQFRATVLVPSPPTFIQATGVQSFFPALEPANSTAILQNVIANMGSVLGKWSFFVYFYDPSVGAEQAIHGNHHTVYPGDFVASGFILMNDSEQWVGLTKPYQWFVEWRDRRGVEGLANGEVDISGNTTMDLSAYPDVEDFTQAILAFEFYRNAKWEMGPLSWSNIHIQINDTKTDWCSVDKFIVDGVTISDIGPVNVYPAITGITCFFTSFTLTQYPTMKLI
ncbi:hypothetical protein DSL72_006323 [Monilinia vaccinii-corymbosi]|uniref:Uncharacterized protein n=1 Tax=Monilinia vaccinii-corymbosi TaxID=61207 RepID=A0A8A3PNE8_9HELO|nr:hypothetical protein DSL72_006323 [Monilinia vaccinii-corymbosi]